MKKNNTWVVTIDFSPIDTEVINYAKYLGALQRPEKIYFVNVVKEFVSYISEGFQGVQEQILMDQKLQQENKVDMLFKDVSIPHECHIMTGTPFEEVIELVQNKSASLVIAGKKKISTGSGIVSERLSRNLPCDILLVTEDFKPNLSNVLVTTDFSERADLSMEKALELLSEKREEINFYAHHSYSVPFGYSILGKSYDEFAEIMKSSAEKEMFKWLRKFDHKISPILTLKGETSFAKQVIEQTVKLNIDLIVMGTRGQTAASLELLGSNTMKVLKEDTQVPILIVKKPGENISFIDSMRTI